MASTNPQGQECVYTEYDQGAFIAWRKGVLQAWSTTWIKLLDGVGIQPAAIVMDCESRNVVVTLAQYVSFNLDKCGTIPHPRTP